MITRIIAAASLLATVGCAGLGQGVRISEMSSEEIRRYNEMQLLPSGSAPSEGTLGRVEGLSCGGDGQAVVSEAEALDQLKMKAAKLGARSLSNVACQYHGRVDWKNNCWKSYTCVGDAFQSAIHGARR